MSFSNSPLIVTKDLTFYYDMNNVKKSYKGKPITNQYAVPTPDANGNVTFAVNGTGTFKRIYTGTYGGYEIQPTDIVYRYDLGAGGCHYHGNSAAIAAGQYATMTFDYYVSQNAANYPTDNLLANFENYGGGGLGGGSGALNTTRGIWQTITFTAGPTSASGTQAMFLYPGSCGGSYLASSGFILYKNPQVIFSSSSNDTQAFTTGTRPTTDVLKDLGPYKYSITADSLTYSGSTFSFNGSSDFMTLGSVAPSGNAARSIFAWIKTSTGSRCIVSTGTPATGQAFNLVTYGSNKIGVMGYSNDFYPSSGATVTDNVWHYVGAVANGAGGITTYVDGVVDNTGSITYSTTGQSNYIGKSNHVGAENYFNGSISNVMMYSRALSSAEIAQNYNALRGRYGV